MSVISTGWILLLGVVAGACSSEATPGDTLGGSAGTGGGAGTSGTASVSGSGGLVGTSGSPGTSGSVGTSGGAGSPGTAGGGSPSGGSGTGGSSSGSGGGVQVTDPGSEGDGKQTVTNMAKQMELTDLKNPKGKEFTFKLTSKSYMYTEPTIAAGSPKNQPRNVWVYVPAQYKDGTEAPLMVIQDGQQGSGTGGRYGSIKLALDNMTIATDPKRKIPAFVAIAVQDGGGDGPNNERGLEYDTISERYGLFVQNEVIPAVKELAELKAAFPGFKLTDNPEGKATFGCSSGGSAALTMAWFHPELFRRVVTYSGTFVAQQNGKLPDAVMYPSGAWGYHHDQNLIAMAEKKPLRIFNNANQNDNGSTSAETGKHNWLIANEATHTALEAKGYHNRYVYGVGVGHCDDNLLRATLADTLAWVWRGYPAP
jgi:iron(III)-enterobactin esterase